MTGETSRFPETYFWLIVQISTTEASLKNNLNVIYFIPFNVPLWTIT